MRASWAGSPVVLQKAAAMRSPKHALSAVIVADVDARAMNAAVETMAVIVDKTNAKTAAVIVAIGRTAMNPVANPEASSAKHVSPANRGKTQGAAVTSGVKIVMVNRMPGRSRQTSSARTAGVIVAASPRASAQQAAQAQRRLQPPQSLQRPRAHRRRKGLIKSARAVVVDGADAVDVKAERTMNSWVDLKKLPKLRPPNLRHQQLHRLQKSRRQQRSPLIEKPRSLRPSL